MMIQRRWISRFLIMVTGLVLLGCTNPTAPAWERRTYFTSTPNSSSTSTSAPSSNTAKAISAFGFSSLGVVGSIATATDEITAIVPYGTDLTTLVPTIIHNGASVSPVSGVANDFSTQAIYTVTATDGLTRAYTVTVTTTPPALTTYSVTYNANSATSGTAPATQTKTQGTSLTLAVNSGGLARSGYTFAGWNTAADGSGTTYAVGAAYTPDAALALFTLWTALPTYSLSMQLIPAGSFNNGTSSVALSAFRMSTDDITQSKYQAIMGTNPSHFSTNTDAAMCPVEEVTWFDAVEFCNSLSTADGLQPVYTLTGRVPSSGYPITGATVTATWANSGYRLPTEAQWEYAARANTTTNYYWGNASDIGSVGPNTWYDTNSGGMTHAVGQKLANNFGLHDMAGNVWQWVWDWSGSYPSGAQTDPTGPASGTAHVSRGGAFDSIATSCDSAHRTFGNPSYHQNNIGFRVVCP